jgi:hypothetical protein
MEEKIEKPLYPEIRNLENLNLNEVKTCAGAQFSPPLSSTCIGSPDYGKETDTAGEQIKKTA